MVVTAGSLIHLVMILPNVLFLHFDQLKEDMPSQIRRIAAFLEINIDEATWPIILKHCSFDYMKAHAAASTPLGGIFWDEGAKVFINKGTNGRWRNTLTADDIAAYEQIALVQLGVECAHWLATGEYR